MSTPLIGLDKEYALGMRSEPAEQRDTECC